ncbi:Nucleoside-diphosphate-sugar epimerase [Planctomycetales bacterium 10988]|nr:Nucleoside-diphosphate-sugar epimerase [Planctomycetales bacterium 10988]
MNQTVLITGGAGFIGSHLCQELLDHDYKVRALDNLLPEVHGTERSQESLNPEVEWFLGDIRDEDLVNQALNGVQIVCHLASVVGVGQSMINMSQFSKINTSGSASFCEILVRKPIERLVIASSNTIYGEGMYQHPLLNSKVAVERNLTQLQEKKWELRTHEGTLLEPIATPEEKYPNPRNVYALTKYDQEQLALMLGAIYEIPTVALRFFNVYGPAATSKDPSGGVLRNFASQILTDRSPLIYEDGHQRRDFVHVRDIVRSCRLAIEAENLGDRVFNIGSGQGRSLLQVARQLANLLEKPEIEPEVTQRYRHGDIRHCFADIQKAKHYLGYQPSIEFQDGLKDWIDWFKQQDPVDIEFYLHQTLDERGLLV